MEKDKMDLERERLEILYGGVMVKVARCESAAQPRVEEQVKVRQLPIWEVQQIGEVIGQVVQEVGVYTAKPADWVKSLYPESIQLVLSEGRRLNEKTLAAWWGIVRSTNAIVEGGQAANHGAASS